MSSSQPPDRSTQMEVNEAFKLSARAIRSQTTAIRLVDAKAVSIAQAVTRVESSLSSQRESRSADARVSHEERELLLELMRDVRSDLREMIRLLYSTQDKLGEQRDKLRDMEDRWTPAQGTQIPPPEAEKENSLTLNREGLALSVSGRWAGAARLAKRIGPALGWLAGLATAAWHGVRHLLGK